MSKTRTVLGLMALWLAACGDSSSDGELDMASAPRDGGVDMGLVDGGVRDADSGVAGPLVLIGTGIDSFEPLVRDGSQVFPIVLGPQGGGRFGGHHIALAVRLDGITPSDLSALEVRVLDEAGEVQATLSRAPQQAPFIAGRDLPSLSPRLDDCCLVADQTIDVEVVATRVAGGEIRDVVRGRASACPQPSQGSSICP